MLDVGRANQQPLLNICQVSVEVGRGGMFIVRMKFGSLVKADMSLVHTLHLRVQYLSVHIYTVLNIITTFCFIVHLKVGLNADCTVGQGHYYRQ